MAGVLWVVGIGARMCARIGFGHAVGHGAGPAITRFSIAHHITSGRACVAALVMMVLAELALRLAIMQLRAARLPVGQAQRRTITLESAPRGKIST